MSRLIYFFLTVLLPLPAWALPPETMHSVVSVLPVWPGLPQGGSGTPPGTAPEGSGVVISEHLIVTAGHVIGQAKRIDIRLENGRILPVSLVARDNATDIALLRSDEVLPQIAIADDPEIADPVCAIGNAFGLGLSVSCGVVSALNVTHAGFNPIEDFIQTDTAVNPGSSGGALVNANGELVGMVSAIFASGADANLGINFAVSTELLRRVASDLDCKGSFDPVKAGWQLRTPSREQLLIQAGAIVESVVADGPAALSGVKAGDLLTKIGNRAIRSVSDAMVAVALEAPSSNSGASVIRNGSLIHLPDFPDSPDVPPPTTQTDCYQHNWP